jgi:hypothetical protein
LLTKVGRVSLESLTEMLLLGTASSDTGIDWDIIVLYTDSSTDSIDRVTDALILFSCYEVKVRLDDDSILKISRNLSPRIV